MIRKLALLAAIPLVLSACSATNQGVRGAAVGAGAGALAGAVIGNNVGDGDAETGAVGGAMVGCQRPGGCGHSVNNPNHSELYYDRYSGRYWYEDYRNGATYWQNGEPRTAPRPRY